MVVPISKKLYGAWAAQILSWRVFTDLLARNLKTLPSLLLPLLSVRSMLYGAVELHDPSIPASSQYSTLLQASQGVQPQEAGEATSIWSAMWIENSGASGNLGICMAFLKSSDLLILFLTTGLGKHHPGIPAFTSTLRPFFSLHIQTIFSTM